MLAVFGSKEEVYSWDELKPQGDIGKPGKKKNKFYTCELKSRRVERIEENTPS